MPAPTLKLQLVMNNDSMNNDSFQTQPYIKLFEEMSRRKKGNAPHLLPRSIPLSFRESTGRQPIKTPTKKNNSRNVAGHTKTPVNIKYDLSPMNGISAFRSSFSCKKNKKMSCKALN
jgi:hypothetical protein